VIPTYYARNADGEPEAWIKTSKASMKSVLPQFNTIRMAMDYLRDSYAPAAREGRLLDENQATGARELAQWKQRIARAWSGIRARIAEPVPTSIRAGETLSLDVAVHLNGLDSDDVFVECVVADDTLSGETAAPCSEPLSLVGRTPEGEALYHCDLFDDWQFGSPGGLQQFRIRLYPCHPLLSHPLECGLMMWL
ncbi:MAG: DUF3417 domain-containing protein, partial [Pseudomonadota bacterium]|nr:DUF3417 domain-containing protein [Pseudomonadota bacterium]